MKFHCKVGCFAVFLFTGSLVSQVTIEDFNWYQDDASIQYAWKATQEAVGPYLEKALAKSGNAMRLSLQFSGTNPGTSIEGKVYERTVARVDRIYKNGIDLSGCGEIVLSLYVPDKEIIDNLAIRLYSPAGNPSGNNYFWTWRDIKNNPDIENGWNEIVFPKNSFSKAGLPEWNVIGNVLLWFYESLEKDTYVIVEDIFGRGLSKESEPDPAGEQPELTFVPHKISGRSAEYSDIYYQRMVRWTEYGNSRLFGWNKRPGTRRYVSPSGSDGSGERPIRSCANIALSYAILYKFGEFPGKKTVRDNAIELIRYLTYTHVTGPETCDDGKKWSRGENQYIFKTEWQTSWHAARMGIATWILWDDLGQETRRSVAKVIIHEADRVSCIKPPGNRVEDTKAEENAFNSVILSLAANMFGGHPHAERWREKANVYLMNVHSVAADVEDNTIVDGKPVKEWVVTENCRPDFLIENHGEVSSGYLVWSTHLRLQSALNYIMAGNAVPEAATFHLDKVYENLLKSGATGDKNEALFYVLFGNADARRIEEKYVKTKMIPGQDDFTEGRFHGQPEPADVWESESLSYFAYDFLVHYMAGDKAIPLIEYINTACEQPDPAEMKSSVSAEVKLGTKDPGEEKSIPVELITSEEVQEIPAALLMVESDSSVTKILLIGQVPGTRFTGSIGIDEDLAEGPAFFRLTEGSLVDREGKRSNAISVNDTLNIDRTAPPTPLHFKVLK